MKPANYSPIGVLSPIQTQAGFRRAGKNRCVRWLALTVCLIASGPVLAQDIWNGSAGTTNWSTPGNWSSGASPASGDPVLFDNATPLFALSGVVDNIVDANFNIYSLQYSTISTNGYHTTFINPGQSLNINSSGGNALWVEYPASTVGAVNIYERMLGPGTLTVTNTSGIIWVAQGGDNNDHYATLDLSGLTNFAASVNQIYVGVIANTGTYGFRPMGIMRLADTNYIQTAAGTNQPGILVACYPTTDTNLRGTEQMFLGRNNVIACDALTIGGTKTTGQILSRPGITNGYAQLRGSAGGTDKVKMFTIGDGLAGAVTYAVSSSGSSSSGTFDSTGTYLDALVQELYVPRSQTNNNGTTTGVLTFDQGSITTDNAYVGYTSGILGTAGSFNSTGTVNINGNASLIVNNNLFLGRKAGTNTPSATLNLSTNATASVSGNVYDFGGTGTINFNSGGKLSVAGNVINTNGNFTVNFNNGGLLDMQPAGDPAPGSVLISTLTGSGVITNATTVTNTAALTPGTALSAGTLTVYGNMFLSNNAVFNVNVGSATTPGAGINDLVTVNGNVTLNNNTLVLAPIGGSLAAGTYQILTNTGTRTGSLNFTNPTRYTVALSYQPNEIDLTASGASGNVRWNSATSNTWDLVSSNWFNTGSSATDKFLQLDGVLVDDSGSYTNLLLLTTTLFPNTVTVNSSTRDYFFGGGGKISGNASLLKTGTSSLSISNANDFNGAVTINNGILRTVNASALGSTNGTTTVASGGTLDVFGQSFYSPGEIITIAGTGLNSTGAVINTGAAQNNAIRFLNLSGDATIRGDNRFDVRGPGGAGTFNGALNLNGFTLTKLGAAQQSLADVTATNAGSIIISNGILGLTRSLVDGPGYINVLTNTLYFENSSTGYLSKPISVAGGNIRAIGNSLTVNSAITNLAPGVNLTVDSGIQLTLTNTITGAGALTKNSAGILLLLAPDTCTGPTTIAGGRLAISTNSALALTPSIAVAAGAFFDVSALSGGFTLQGSQTLSGGGSVIGDVTASSGANVSPGASAGTLTFSNNLTLNSVTNLLELGSDPTQIGNNVNDLIAVSSNLTLNGVTTLRIQALGPLSGAQPYTVMTYAGTLTGGAANLQVTSSNPRYVFTLVDPATTPGSIQISVSGNPTTLQWRGAALSAPTAWDGVTSNWFNGTTSDSFFTGDTVVFDDTANTNRVTLVGTEQPGLMTVSSTSLVYAFGGSGGLIAGSLTKQNAGSVTFSNSAANSIASGLTLNAGSLVFQNPTNTFSGGIQINGGTLTFNQPLNETVTTSISNSTPGVAGTLVLASPTTLTLSANNTNFDGPIFVNAGILKAANSYALGNNNGATTIANGATLDVNGTSLYNPGDDIIISGFGLSNTGAVVNTAGAQQNAIRSLILSNNAAIASWTTATRWDVRGPGGSGSFSGNLNLNGYTLTKLGAGTNSIVDANVQNAGTVNIAGGTLSFTRCSVPAAGVVNVSSNVLVFENYTAGNFSMPVTAGGGTIRLFGNAFSFDSPVTSLAGGLTLEDSSGNNLTVAGDITGPGSLTKTGTSTVVLTALNNAWGGSTTIAGGTLQIGSGTGAPDGSLPDLPIINNATLVFNSQNSFTNSTGISGSGVLTQTSGGTVMLAASNSFTGAVNLNATAANSPSGSFLIISNSYGLGTTDSVTFIDGNTTGNATLELMGNITVPETLSLSARQAGTVDTPHVLNASGNNTLTGQMIGTTGGNAYNFQSDSGKLTVAGNFVPPSTAGTRDLKLMGDGNGEWSGVISNSADGLVPALVIKQGNGTWTLSGSNVYFGATTITAGTLALGAAGSINASPSIDVQSGALFNVSAVSGGYVLRANQSLVGNGAVVGNVTASGTVAPGESAIGTLAFSNSLVLAGTNIMEIDRLNAPYADLIVAASVTYGGTLVVTNLTDPLQLGDTFTLFSANTRSGSFSSMFLPPLDPSLAWDTSKLAVNGTIKVGPSVASNPTNIVYGVSGNNLTLSWPQDHVGWTLLVQTNNLAAGVSTNRADWGPVAGSSATNQVVIPVNTSLRSEFYKLAYPYP